MRLEDIISNKKTALELAEEKNNFRTQCISTPMSNFFKVDDALEKLVLVEYGYGSRNAYVSYNAVVYVPQKISIFPIQPYNAVLSFDFTIKNNELARKNIELKSQLKENFDESLKKQQEAATTVRVQEEEKTTKENQEVVKTA